MSCPFKSKLTINENSHVNNIYTCPFKNPISTVSTNRTSNPAFTESNNIPKYIPNNDEEQSEDEEQYSGSCPVINRSK